MLVALVGGLAVLAGWFLLPFISGPLGGYTALQVLGLLELSPVPVQDLNSVLPFIVAPGVAGLLIAIVAGTSALSTWQREGAAPTIARIVITSAALSGLAALVYLALPSTSGFSILAFAGSGFWVTAFGLLAAFIGALAAY